MKQECLISVDIEASGPIPGEYSMLSLGACLVFASEKHFRMDLQPITRKFDAAAMSVIGGSLEDYDRIGLPPQQAMEGFRKWVVRSAGMTEPIFVGFNAPFDWAFVNYYFHRFLGENPFGFTALDIKALYMGRRHTTWTDTKSSRISAELGVSVTGDHDPLHDAIYQAELCRAVLQV